MAGSHEVRGSNPLGSTPCKDASILRGDITELREAVARPLPESPEVIACLMSRAGTAVDRKTSERAQLARS
jgi:hypothetical protein